MRPTALQQHCNWHLRVAADAKSAARPLADATGAAVAAAVAAAISAAVGAAIGAARRRACVQLPQLLHNCLFEQQSGQQV
jgi:hypothetical protein